MTPLLIIVGITVFALLIRPAPRTHVIYVPVDVAEEPTGLGCLPLIVVGIVALLLLALAGIL